MKALAATPRTIAAIRKADAVLTVRPGGRMNKGAYPGGFGGGASPYSGMFAVYDGTDYSVEIPEYIVAVTSGVVQVNRKFYDVDPVELEVPIFATGEAPQWGWIVADFLLDPETLVLGEPEWDIVENVTTDFLEINYGRIIVGRVAVTVNPDTDDGRFEHIQDVYGVALCPIFGECPEEEEEVP